MGRARATGTILAEALAEPVFAAAKVAKWRKVAEAVDLTGSVLAHPLAALDRGYCFEVPMLAGDHVTDDAGTGFVHTAPGHGSDDYALWINTGHRDIPQTVDEDGVYFPEVPLFAGLAGCWKPRARRRASSAPPTPQ